MNFSILKGFHSKWQDIIVIGKTTERNGKKYHIVGITLSDEAKLYIIEPYMEPESRSRKGIRNHRRMLKEHERNEYSYLHCSDLCLGDVHLKIQGGMGSPMDSDNYGMIQLFFDMMGAGWTVPEWLKDIDWENLMLLTLNIAEVAKLPHLTPQTPITITHRPNPIQHIIEKTVTLNVGKSRSFCFVDNHGDEVLCHINSVALIDVWKNTEEELNDPKLAERFSPEQLKEAAKHSYDALEQCCPKGMCYIGIEYECSKNYDLTFYSKQYLKSRPETHQGSSHFLMMRLKPDQETGTHGLPLKGCVIQTPVPPDTIKIPAELFLYHERVDEWTETINVPER